MKHTVPALCIALAVAGCASSPQPSAPTPVSAGTQAAAAPVRIVDARSVENCQFLNSITQSQYSGMLFAGQGLRGAQTKVLDSAAAQGATHVVWGDLNAGGAIQTATGTAYRCA